MARAHPYTNKHRGLGDYLYDLSFDAIEINGALSEKYHIMAEMVTLEMNIPTIGGSNAHSIRQLNTIGTKFENPVNSMLDIIKGRKKRI